MKVYVVNYTISDWYGESTTIDSIFSTEELALSRASNMSRIKPDLDWFCTEYEVDDLVGSKSYKPY
jgi:hypothetical protein